MAGYLGTLFMANVGMRLLLPPKSQFQQASTQFGKMVKGIEAHHTRYYTKAGQANSNTLARVLQRANALSDKYAEDNSQSTLRHLSKNLSRISQMTKGAIVKTGKGMWATAGAFQKKGTRAGVQADRFWKQNQAGLSSLQSEMASAERRAASFSAQWWRMADLIGQTGSYLLGTFQQALMISVTGLTTLGYTIQGIAADFGVFERELINANSIWQESNETLYSISDQVVKFGEDYGVAYDNASRVLYQFASAGLDAAESQAVLTDVLKLSMAVQGDANTIGKLTVQTIKGFGLEMADSEEVTDKFAHAINASLIEYQDLAAAIKFALPFFAATNQNLDQLLGSIQILTDRALEAGIAGRGLRQALAEFAEGAQDSTRKMHEMGVTVVDAEGNFLKMTEIARNFANVVGTEVANDTELLTALIDDLNIRGATAFIHLVQNVDEFEAAVSDLANSQGASNRMAEVQQGSLVMQIQLLRNAAKEVFFLSDETYVAQGYMNEFDMRLKQITLSLKELFIKEMPDGTKQLTDLSYLLRDVVITSLEGFQTVIETLVKGMAAMATNGWSLTEAVKVLFVPISMLTKALFLADKIIGMFPYGDGLLMKFFIMSRVFGGMGAGIFMAAQAMQYFLNIITGGSEAIEKLVGVLLMVASVTPIGRGANMILRGGASARMGLMGGKKGLMGGQSFGTSNILRGGTPGAGHISKKGVDLTRTQRSYHAGMDDVMYGAGRPQGGWGQMGTAGGRAAMYPKPVSNLLSRDAARKQARRNLAQQGIVEDAANKSWYHDLLRKEADRLQLVAKNTPVPPGLGINPMATQTARGREVRKYTDDFFVNKGYWQLGYGSAGMAQGMYMYNPFGMFNKEGWATQNQAYDSYMAQLRTSSDYGGGGTQDLYISNANIGSTNFQDLFYNSDQLGGT